MKITTTLVLLAISLNLVMCRPTVEQLINNIAPRLLSDAVDRGVLPSSGYYLHHINSVSSPSATSRYLNINIRGLNNQTSVDLRATVTDTYRIASWNYNFSLTSRSRNLSEGIEFGWFNYAASSGNFCVDIGSEQEAFELMPELTESHPRLPIGNVNVTGAIKNTYDFAVNKFEDVLTQNGELDVPPIDFLQLFFSPEYFVLRSRLVREVNGGDTFFTFDTIYQPCTGKVYSQGYE